MSSGDDQQARQADGASVATAQVEFAELWRPTEDGGSRHGLEHILLDDGRITQEQLADASALQKQTPHLTVLEALIQSKAIDSVTATEATAKYFHLPFSRLIAAEVDGSTATLLPTDYIESKRVIPIRKDGEAVVLGIVNPADIFLIDDVKRRINHELHLVVVPAEDIVTVMNELSTSTEEQVNDIIKDIAEDSVEIVKSRNDEVADLEKIAGESPVIRYVNYLIASAVRDEASDIHIEPCENHLRVRCRIDGILFEQLATPMKMHAAIISRLKIMANLDISERRLPQDGRIRACVHGTTIDLRVSTLPSTHGEKCVIRILDNRSILVGLDNLGMWDGILKAFHRQIAQPHGVILVTGPTGSGKSTTLYCALQVMDGQKLNISTVEDPVEYELDVATQINVRDHIGLSFAVALRSLLRQDPDVIMIGEIRDSETARIAVQASLTGHLVLSTLHTNDAPSSITRLIDIGIEPYLISASVNAILAQRLVRRICDNCKTRVVNVSESAATYLQEHGGDPHEVFHGEGCDKCRNTGYKGRLGLYEFLEIDEVIREAISSKPDLGNLRRAAGQAGMRTLLDDGLQKIASGLTTPEEIMRVTEI